MTNQEKLIEFITSLTEDEANQLISYLELIQTFGESALHPPPSTKMPNQSVSA